MFPGPLQAQYNGFTFTGPRNTLPGPQICPKMTKYIWIYIYSLIFHVPRVKCSWNFCFQGPNMSFMGPPTMSWIHINGSNFTFTASAHCHLCIYRVPNFAFPGPQNTQKTEAWNIHLLIENSAFQCYTTKLIKHWNKMFHFQEIDKNVYLETN